jgi:hypothetical protein
MSQSETDTFQSLNAIAAAAAALAVLSHFVI